jgi:tRNA-(ms[2]io[6]A)-hydroxylase
LTRWPGQRAAPRGWVRSLSRIAREEAHHLRLVVQLLERRGGSFSKSHRNRYAADLRALIRSGEGPLELLDRLLVCALIEARSCERFTILAAHADDELKKLYGGLLSSEDQHFKTFVALARHVAKPAEVDQRWQWMLEAEADIAAAQPAGPHIL